MKNIKFYGQIALEYRLSLDNLCRFLRMDINDENKKQIYDAIIRSFPYIYLDIFKYLFNYETILEPSFISKKSYKDSAKFIKDYIDAGKKENSIALKNQILKNLSQTDLQYKELRLNDELSLKDVEIISRYRVKYAISRIEIAEALNISREELRRKENLLQDEILKYKLNELNVFLSDVKIKNSKGEIHRR